MFRNFRLRLILQSTIIVIFCFVAVGIFGYNRIETVLLENHVKLAILSYEQMYQNVQLSIEWIENTVNQFTNDGSFTNALSSETYNLNLPNRLSTLSHINSNIVGTIAFSETGFSYQSALVHSVPSFAAFSEIPQISDFLDSEEISDWFLMDNLPWRIRNQGQNQEFLVHAIKVYDDYDYIGLLVLTVRTDAILSMLQDSGEVYSAFLCRQNELSETPVVTVDRAYISIFQGFFDFNIVSLLSLDGFYRQMQTLRNLLLLAMLLCLVLLIFIYYKFTDRIFEALNNLNTQIKNYKQNT